MTRQDDKAVWQGWMTRKNKEKNDKSRQPAQMTKLEDSIEWQDWMTILDDSTG